jgi:hypothetical protein
VRSETVDGRFGKSVARVIKQTDALMRVYKNRALSWLDADETAGAAGELAPMSNPPRPSNNRSTGPLCHANPLKGFDWRKR